ncbi:hypothetical protein JYU34_006957 [Plutella xylostella]|uniref:Transporter n=1 Tax=Plutella xylostella TaxID=51655 RepID=A0ABQ7QTB4_PLUXY|nr:hypothetical protein JYU34_006957 [Plutella xylostella]
MNLIPMPRHPSKTSLPRTSSDAPGSPGARTTWRRPLEFILACLGYAVGLGNVWRFPFLCYRNGGGAFLIPFFLMLMFIGLPIFYLELYIGQYTGMGPLQSFAAISPFYSGLGYCTLVIIYLVLVYYMIIVAWTLFYTVMSIIGQLGWGSCDNYYNSEHCYSGSYDKKCRESNTGSSADLTYYLRKCMTIAEICTLQGLAPADGKHCLNGTNRVPWYSNITRVLASEEYYNERVLGLGGATWARWGSLQWHLVACLFVSWVITFLCVIKGVASAGKVVYFTALFPYVMLTVLLVRGVTLPGAGAGLFFFLNPTWDTLLEARVWGDAASQVACGSLITLASYNRFENNCHFDAVFVSVANFGTSVYAGFAIFSVMGFLALSMGVSVHDVAASGPGLAFVAYPEAILQMPLPQLWAVLFFFNLFTMGIGSQFAGVECVNSAIVYRWPWFRDRYWKSTAFTCSSCFVLGLPMCFSGGVYLFTILDWNTASWAILLVGAGECIAVAWTYGSRRALADLADMGMPHPPCVRLYWTAAWKYIVPVGSMATLIFVLVDWSPPSYREYRFPLMAEALGWLVGISTLVLFPIGVLWAWRKGYKGKKLFEPTEDWQPSMPAAPSGYRP